MLKTEHILTVAIFGHGCEYLLDPFPESDIIGDFYKNKVRVFSQACVPDLPSVTGSHQHKSISVTVRDIMQKKPKNSDTFSILDEYMSSCKPHYVDKFNESKKKERPDFDQRLFDPYYNNRFCGKMTYLANKTFYLYETSPTERSAHLHGVVLLDVRLKKTFEDGHVEYEKVFNPPRNNDPIVLTTHDGLLYLLKNVLGKKTKECNEYLKFMGLSSKTTSKLDSIDLIKLFDILRFFDFINILDYTCRECMTDFKTLKRREMSPRKIEDNFEKEQWFKKKMEIFGGTRRNKKGKKTRKIRKKLK